LIFPKSKRVRRQRLPLSALADYTVADGAQQRKFRTRNIFL
jgi:hypothetical protein